MMNNHPIQPVANLIKPIRPVVSLSFIDAYGYVPLIIEMSMMKLDGQFCFCFCFWSPVTGSSIASDASLFSRKWPDNHCQVMQLGQHTFHLQTLYLLSFHI
jgi:hypothetical protein